MHQKTEQEFFYRLFTADEKALYDEQAKQKNLGDSITVTDAYWSPEPQPIKDLEWHVEADASIKFATEIGRLIREMRQRNSGSILPKVRNGFYVRLKL